MPGTPIDIEAICQTIKQLMESLDGIDTSNAIHKRVEQTIERLLVEIETGLCTEQAK